VYSCWNQGDCSCGKGGKPGNNTDLTPVSDLTESRVTTCPGKSWNLGRPVSRPGKSWKTAKVLESHGKHEQCHAFFNYGILKLHRKIIINK